MTVKKIFLKGLKDSAYYFLGDAGTQLVKLLVIPFITLILPVEEFGHYDLMLLIASMISLAVGVGMDSGFAVLIADKQVSQTYLDKIFSLSLVFVTLASIIVFALGFLLNSYFTWFPGLEMSLIITFAGINALNTLIFNFLRWREKPREAAITNFLGSNLGLIGGLLLIYFSESLSLYLLVGLSIGSAISLIINLLTVKKHINLSVSKKDIDDFRLYLLVSFPFVPNYLAGYFLKSSDRWLIITFLDLKAMGYYAVISRISQVVNIGVNLVGKGYLPVLFQNYQSPNGSRLIKLIYNNYMLLSIVLFVVTYFTASMVLGLFAKDYEVEPFYLVVLIMAIFFSAGRSLNGFGFIIGKRTSWISYVSILSLLVNVVISYLLIPKWGLAGVLFGTFISMMLASITYTLISEKIYSFNYNKPLIFASHSLITGLILWGLFL